MIEWLKGEIGPVETAIREMWRKMIWEADDYEPTEMQAEYIFDNARIKQVSGGVRAGKSKSVARSCDWWTPIPGGKIWIVGPDYAQTRNEFRYMMQPYQKLGMLVESKTSMPKEGSWVFVVDGGATVETKSADALEKIAGEAPDAILITEAGQHEEGILSKSLERALEKNSPVIFSGTFEEAYSWYADQWLEWQGPNALGARSYSLPTWSNTYIFPQGEDDPRFAEMRDAIPEDIYLERIEAVPYKPSGLVFRDAYDEARHVVDLEYNPNLPLEVAMDPATHAYPVMFIQWQDDRVFVVDEIYMRNAITQQVIPVVKEHKLWPHVTGGTTDVASRQRQANYSVIELWTRHAGLNLRSQSVGIQRGIDALTLRLGNGANGVPRILFSQKMMKRRRIRGRATGILAEFGMYHWGSQSPNGNTRRLPVDAHNDAIKATSYWLIDRYGDDVLRDWTMAIESQTMAYPWMQII